MSFAHFHIISHLEMAFLFRMPSSSVFSTAPPRLSPSSFFFLKTILFFSSVQSLSCVRFFATPWTSTHQASLSITNSQSPPKSTSIESVTPSNHLILCCPLFLLPSIFPSIGVFSNESALRIRWSKYWRFRFNISPSNEYPGPISFRMDWLDLLAVQGTLKSLLQHHSSKASILWHSAFFIVQLSHPYMTTVKTRVLTKQIFVGFLGKQISYNIAYMWNLEKWGKWTYLQNRNRDTEEENKLMNTKGARGWAELICIKQIN